jgi:PAS domain S-box-containing protein
LHVLEWVPRVPADERAAFETAMRAAGAAHYVIWEPGEDGTLVEAGQRAEYFPVAFIEPIERYALAVGLDLGSQDVGTAALMRARDRAETSASGRVRLLGPGPQRYGVRVFVPVYKAGAATGAPGERATQLEGYCVGLFDVATVLAAARRLALPTGVAVEAFDVTDGTELIAREGMGEYGIDERMSPVAPAVKESAHVETIAFGGRRWTIVLTAARSFVVGRRTQWPLATLFGGLVFTGLAAMFVVHYGRRSVELAGKNDELRHEIAEHRRAEDMIVRERAFLRQVIDLDPSFIFARDRAGRFTLANRAVADAYGTTVEALLGRTHTECHPNPDEVAHFRRDDLEVMDTGREKLVLEEAFTDAHGRKRWVQTVKRGITSPDGTVESVLGVATDVTERKQAADALRASEERLRTLAEAVPIGIFLADPAGRNLYTNRRWTEICGTVDPESETIAWQAIHPDDRVYVADVWRRATAHGESYDLEFRLMAASGALRWVHIVGMPFQPPGGTVSGYVGSVQDVTQRKTVEEEIRALNTDLERRVDERTQELTTTYRFQRAILDSAPGLIVGTDLRGLVQSFSAGAERMLGWRSEEVIGRATPFLWHDADEIRGRAAELSSERGYPIEPTPDVLMPPEGSAILQREWTFVARDGRRIPVLLTVAALSDEEGIRTGYLGVAIDVGDRIRAEQERDRFFALAIDLFCIAGTDGYFKRVNAAFTTVLGYTAEELYAQPFLDFVHPDDLGVTMSQLEKLASGERVLHIENRYRRKDGTWRWLSWRSVSEGTEIYATARDVTELKATLETLRQTTEELRDLYDHAPCGYHSLNAEAVFMRINETELGWLGYTRDELVGRRSFRELLTHASRHVFDDSFLQLKEVGSVRGLELEVVRKDGSVLPVLLSATAIKDAESGFVVSRSTMFDISERRATEESMRRFRTALDSSADALFLIDRGTMRFVDVNTTACTSVGYSREELLNMGPHDIEPRWTREALASRFDEIIASAEHRGTIETVHRRRDGTEFPVEVRLTTLVSGGGNTMIATAWDVTERRRAEAEVAELNHALEARAGELEAANRELESFSYCVSHDLRAPLRAIDGFARILDKEQGPRLDPSGHRRLDVIRENTGRMSALIDALLALSRVGRKPLASITVDMTSLAHEVADEARRGDPDRRVSVMVGALPDAHGDPTLLRQVLVNLIGNAFKYPRRVDTPHVDVGSVEHDGTTVYFVRDNGAGFDMQHASKLFRSFERLHGPDEFDGIGIGLALVARIVERHGGRVWAEARVNEGATFFFTLVGARAVRPTYETAPT